MQLNAREAQEREAAAADILRVSRQARQAAGAARLQALESGVRGRSVDMLLNTFEVDRLAAVGAIDRNLDFVSQQIQAQRRSAMRIQPRRRIEGPFDSPFGIFATGLQGAGAYYGATPTTGPAPV